MAQQPMMTYFLPPSIQFGAGAIRNLGEHVVAFKGQKPFVVTDEGVTKAGILSKAIEPLAAAQIEYAVFDAIQPNPIDLSVLKGVDAYRAEGCDLVIAVGGGSVMDAAKAIRILTTHEPPLEPYYVDVGGVDRITGNLPALICVPTTAGTGSEVSQGAVITDTSGRTTEGPRKRAIVTPYNMSSLSLLDAELTVGMPPGLTAATGMDAVTHGIEAYVATRYHPIAEGVALQALKILGKNIRQVYHHGDDIEARAEMLIASSMAAFSFQKGLGAVHSLAHQLSPEANIPHGIANAILLPHVMTFNLPHAVDGYADIAAALGVDTSGMSKKEAAHAAIDEVNSLNKELGMPAGLGAAGLKRERIPKIAKDAMLDHCYKFNPRPCTEADMRRLYEAAF
ncbi:MAG: iron-containing alcohol dehydrogenase [Candidatus Poribacteria bacterium]|nr:iron-containing alcohol dehydrogenase [Candidatus Poribacteria bacterium]